MVTRPISEDAEATTRLAAQRHTRPDGTINITALADELKLSRSAVQHRIKRMQYSKSGNVVFPDFLHVDEHEPIDEIRARMTKNYTRRRGAADARKWFSIKIAETKPYGVLWFGDPHLDDDGCNWPLVEEHTAIARRPGIYGANIGDTTNNWVGRLLHKYSHQELSKTGADRLAEWLMLESGVTWLVWLLGNHDMWNNGGALYKRMGAARVPVIDWRAKFQLEHSTGTRIRVDASHGRKGSSIYNELHGTLREAKMGELADIYVTGHTHNYAMEHLEIAARAHDCWLLQLRGYKELDEYALVNGFPECRLGAAVLVIIDPVDGKIKQCFADVAAGADYLEWLRK